MITLAEFTLFWLALVFAIQLVYILVVFGKLAFYKEEVKGNISVPAISVIIAARNEYENLLKLIPMLLAQDHTNFEVIIVDDRSTDESFMYLLKLKEQEPRIKHCRIDHTPEHINPKKFALTMGIKAAQHDHLLFTDADCLPSSNSWIREMAGKYQEKEGAEFVLGFSQYEKEPGFLNTFIRFETLLVGVQYLSFALWGKPYMGIGRNLSYKKEAFFRIKGFLKHKHITGGDDDLFVNEAAKGKKTTIAILESTQTTSIPKKTWADWYHQKLRHLSVGKFYKTSDKILLGLFHSSHIGFYVMLLLSCLAQVPYYWILGAFGIRFLSLLLVFQLIKDKIDKNFEVYLVPLMDILYIFYYIFVGIVARTTKHISWTR